MKIHILCLFSFIFISIIPLNTCLSQNKVDKSTEKSRNEKWKEDLDYFEYEYLNESRTFPEDSLPKCKSIISKLRSEIESLSDNQIILQLSKCVAMADNGHTTIHLSSMDKIPVRFYWFKDGLYIIKSDKASAKYLGGKVLAINSMKVETVLAHLKPYLSGINSFKKFVATNYLSSPQILNGIGLSDPDAMELTILQGGDTSDVSFKIKEVAKSKYEYLTWANLYPDRAENDIWEYALTANDSLPPYLKNMNKGVFYTFFDTEKIAYFSINALWYKSPDFKGEVKAFNHELKSKKDYGVVIDLRYYTGGNYLLPAKLAKKPPKIINDHQKIYLITSPMTFSAGLVTAARTKYFAKDKIVIVGEEVGDRLIFWAEGDYYKTPHFGVRIQDSKFQHDWENDDFKLGKTFWINRFFGVPAKDLSVDKSIELSYDDYKKGHDPILSWIIEQQ